MGRVSTLTSKSQITIPAEIRRALGIQPGDRVVLELDGDHAVLRALRGSFSDYLDGLGRDVLEAEGGAARYLDRERSTWGD